MVSEEGFKDKIKDRIEDLDWWLYQIDLARPDEELPDPLYESIKSFVKASFTGDFNIILEDFDFYYKLKPSLKFKLTDMLFGEFASRFNGLFVCSEQGYFADQEFKSDFLANLYFRTFLSRNDVIREGEEVDEMCLITKG
jgi:hypothetical protein